MLKTSLLYLCFFYFYENFNYKNLYFAKLHFLLFFPQEKNMDPKKLIFRPVNVFLLTFFYKLTDGFFRIKKEGELI